MFASRPSSGRLSVAVAHALSAVVVLAAFVAASPASGQAVVADEARAFSIAGGTLLLEAPDSWKRVQPKVNIIEAEFAIPSGDDLPPGRMTVMGAGGSVQANLDRWYGQFSQPDGSATKDKATSKTLKLAGCNVTVIDVSGTYKDMPGGPMAGGRSIDRPDYRMLAAIVEIPGAGGAADGQTERHFIKFYGPSATVAKSADGFRKMIEGMVPAGK
jgi:hypothetical protein